MYKYHSPFKQSLAPDRAPKASLRQCLKLFRELFWVLISYPISASQTSETDELWNAAQVQIRRLSDEKFLVIRTGGSFL